MEVIKSNTEILKYKRVIVKDLWKQLESESDAVEALWSIKLGDAGFCCRSCKGTKYWKHSSRSEIRECSSCHRQHRVRAGTLFEHSKLSLLVWLRAIGYVMQDKRGVSALQLKRIMGLPSMATSWLMLMKIRKALVERDSIYKLSGTVELDGAYFVNDHKLKKEKPYRNHTKAAVFVAVEQKSWVDEAGRPKMRAGFAKVMLDPAGQETRSNLVKFVRQSIKPTSLVKTDGKHKNLPDVRTDSRAVSGDKRSVQAHLPWVHKFISNAKRWILGTHHGRISSKYLPYYLGEYTYRFNRRHDPKSLYARALSACILSAPIRAHALAGNA